MVVRILDITECHSDGDPSKWPTTDKGYKRNDDYFLNRIANDFWVKEWDSIDLGGPPSSAQWRLNRLPDGYAGFEKQRGDSKHVDRYLYGHPRGQFRSLQEFYPHFKHLMESGGPVGCQCKICTGNKRASTNGLTTSGSNGARSVSPARTTFSYFTQTQTKPPASKPAPPLFNQTARPISTPLLPQGRLPTPTPQAPRKQVDEDGTTDVFRVLLDELKAAEDDVVIDKKIAESTSPDWRAGNELLKELLEQWKDQPRFVPRTGELVLFVRDLNPEEVLAWDDDARTWHKVDHKSGALLGRPKWEAGVVTQMPLQQVDESDLATVPDSKGNVVNSGFRIEPLSKPGTEEKRYAKQQRYAKQHRYLPLHGLRPLVYWQDCLRECPEAEWHPTIRHVLSVANTFCVIARDRFKGVRNELSGSQATVFCRGAYIGFDLITIGDAVRLLPNPDEQKPDDDTDMLVVTAIKLRLVNIDDAGNDDWDEGRPYTTCLHISGKAFTLDRRRSFDGVGKVPISSDSDLLPAGLEGYGQWYHMTDPEQTKARLEVPFTRILGRVSESVALEKWFQAPASSSPQNDIQQFRKTTRAASSRRLRRGLSGLVEARARAYAEDPRIDRAAGKSWFWADTRVEALDLHEINDRFVGPKDETRSKSQMDSWRKLLRALDGSKHGLAVYHAERLQREEESKKEKQGLAAGSYGMVGAAVTIPDGMSGSGTDGTPQQTEAEAGEDMEMLEVEEDEDDDMVDVDEDEDRDKQPAPNDTRAGANIMNVDVDEDDPGDSDGMDDMDEASTPDVTRAGAGIPNIDGVIELSDDDD
jgi:hypothetical protein